MVEAGYRHAAACLDSAGVRELSQSHVQWIGGRRFSRYKFAASSSEMMARTRQGPAGRPRRPVGMANVKPLCSFCGLRDWSYGRPFTNHQLKCRNRPALADVAQRQPSPPSASSSSSSSGDEDPERSRISVSGSPAKKRPRRSSPGAADDQGAPAPGSTLR